MQLPAGASDSELEEQIIQHLAATAAMRRTHPFGRREGQRNRSSRHGRSQFLVFSAHPGTPPPSHVSSPLTPVMGENEPAASTIASPSTPHRSGVNEQSEHTIQFPSVLADQSSSSSGTTVMPSLHQGTSVNDRINLSHSSPPSQSRAAPSEFQSFSESLKSRISAVSMRFNESISRGTRGWKERLFSRNISMSDFGSEVRREVNAGIASVSRMMERLETRDNERDNQVSVSTYLTDCSVSERDQDNADAGRDSPLNESSATASHAATSAFA
uniref:E3 ubiquitin-protein ligase RHF2A-like n=1 Tax=Rhizophora mucronata TaxID=61149 RepID=A0A2P2LVG9_RHIMU